MLYNLDIYVLKHLQSTNQQILIWYYFPECHWFADAVVSGPAFSRGENVLTSLVWKQMASRAAKAKWLLLVNWVSPQMILYQRSRHHLQPVPGLFSRPSSRQNVLTAVSPSCTWLPVGSVEPRESRDKVTTVRRSSCCCQRLWDWTARTKEDVYL